MKKFGTVWLCALLLSSSAFGIIDVSEGAKGEIVTRNGTTYIAHDPIRINSNADFNVAHGVTGGSGTETDPWIIQDLDINGDFDISGIGYRCCIYIGNTTDHFMVRNCYLHEAKWSGNGPYIAGGFGVSLHNVKNGTITNLTVLNNYVGIEIMNSNNITITNNIASLNDMWGFDIYSSTNLTVIENTISNHKYFGICIHSYNNSIYHNNFINNSRHAYDIGHNYWDDGYPSGGNYWGDYTSTDNFSGINQDQPNSDGIGDMPYILRGEIIGIDDGGTTIMNQDNFPLMYPFNWFGTIPSIADAGSNQEIESGTIVFFNGSNSSDNIFITNYTWSFTYNGSVISLYGVNNSFRFWTVGNYTVTLNITDAAGNWGADTLTVNVSSSEISDIGVDWYWMGILVVIIFVVSAIILLNRRKSLPPPEKQP